MAASACAMGSADSNAPCIIACPAILDAPKPLAAICACTARNVPAAQGGGLLASKLAVSVESCPCTVALSDGVAVAACICSVYVDAVAALAAPDINSPSCIFLVTGLSIILASPSAAIKSDTALVLCSAAVTCASSLTVPVAPDIPSTTVSTSVFVPAVVIKLAS